jgi:hypothetical protein
MGLIELNKSNAVEVLAAVFSGGSDEIAIGQKAERTSQRD